MSTLDTILSFFEGKGLTPDEAAGFAGNWQVESGLNPAAVNPREGAIGLAQWEGGRRAELQQYAAATGSTEDNLITQLNFAWAELQGPESGALAKLKATNDPGTAAAVVDQYYERSSGSSRATRIRDAQAIAAGNPTSTGSTSSGTTSTGTTGGTQNAGLFSDLNPFKGWQNDLMGVLVKVAAGAAAAGLVIVGAVHTVSDK